MDAIIYSKHIFLFARQGRAQSVSRACLDSFIRFSLKIHAFKNLRKYFQSLTPQDAYTKELDEAVASAKEHREWRLEYMKMEAWEQDIRRESRAEGREEGGIINLAGLVYRKVLKGKSPEEIAEDLEEDVSRIKRIYDAVVKHLPEYDPEKILEELGCGETL